MEEVKIWIGFWRIDKIFVGEDERRIKGILEKEDNLKVRRWESIGLLENVLVW